MHAPRVAADLAVLNEVALDVRLEVDFDLLTAVGAGDEKGVVHGQSAKGTVSAQPSAPSALSPFDPGSRRGASQSWSPFRTRAARGRGDSSRRAPRVRPDPACFAALIDAGPVARRASLRRSCEPRRSPLSAHRKGAAIRHP